MKRLDEPVIMVFCHCGSAANNYKTQQLYIFFMFGGPYVYTYLEGVWRRLKKKEAMTGLRLIMDDRSYWRSPTDRYQTLDLRKEWESFVKFNADKWEKPKEPKLLEYK